MTNIVVIAGVSYTCDIGLQQFSCSLTYECLATNKQLIFELQYAAFN